MKLSNEHINAIEAGHTSPLKATIYIPTSPVASAQDRTRLKNALQVIKNNSSYDERELGDVLAKIYEELIDNDTFWNYQDYGLAVLFDHDGYEYFHLPFEITEAEYLTDHFVISPLAIIASADTGYYVLDVNFTTPRLLAGHHGAVTQIDVPNMPKSYDKVMGRSSYKNHSLGGEDNAVGDDEARYLEQIADAVDAAIEYDGRALVLAGTSNRIGHIRGALKHGHILQRGLVGSYEKATTEQIYQDAAPLVLDSLKAERDELVAEIAAAAPELVVKGTTDVEAAAIEGRVRAVLVPAYRVTKDSVQAHSDEMIIPQIPEDIESIEPMIAAVIVKSGGAVVAVETGAYELVGSEPVALLRY